LVEAARLYLEARQSAVDFGARAEALTAGVGVLRVARRAARPLGDLRLDELRHQLLADVATLTDRVKATHPALLRELAAELGDELPTLLVDAARHIGVETEGRTARQLPQSSQEALQRAATRDLPPAPAPTPPPWTSSHEQPPVTSSEVGQNVADALSTSPEDDHLKESLKDYWQSEADRPSFDYDAEGKG
jgi:hypothetical protein